jgi:hypothetical protein
MKFNEYVGIYHADGTPLGEVRYLIGKIRGTAHCALCDITHGWVREKPEFRACRTSLGIPFRTLHLNELDDELRIFTAGKTPCVVGRSDAGWEFILRPDELASCGSDVNTFAARLEESTRG